MFKNLLITMALCVALVGCSSKSDDIVEASYKTLTTAAVVYDAAMSSAADLYKQGHLTEAQYNKVRDAALTYYEAYFAAVDALVAYRNTSSEEGKEQILGYVDVLKSSLNVLLTVAEGIGVDLSSLGVSVDEYVTEEAATTEEPATEEAAIEEAPATEEPATEESPAEEAPAEEPAIEGPTEEEPATDDGQTAEDPVADAA